MADTREPRPLTSSEKQWSRFLEDTLGPVSILLMVLLCFLWQLHPIDKIAAELAMTPEEQDLVIDPLAKLLAKQRFPQEVKDRILQSGDWLGIVIGFTAYGTRVVETLNNIKLLIAQQQGGPSYVTGNSPAQQSPQPVGASGPGVNGTGYAPAQFGGYQ